MLFVYNAEIIHMSESWDVLSDTILNFEPKHIITPLPRNITSGSTIAIKFKLNYAK